MVKRLISANYSEVALMDAQELKQSIKASEGRVLLAENVVVSQPQADDITNAEVAAAFGADLLLLNAFDCFHPYIAGMPGQGEEALQPDGTIVNPIPRLKELIGRPVGINLEPIADTTDMLSEKSQSAKVEQHQKKQFKKQKNWGLILFASLEIRELV